MYLIRERFSRPGEDSDITDEHGRPVLHVDGKVMSLRNRLVLRDPAGREVAQVQRKLTPCARPTRSPSPASRPPRSASACSRRSGICAAASSG